MSGVTLGPWWLWCVVLNLAAMLWVLLRRLPELRDPDSVARSIGMALGPVLLSATFGLPMAVLIAIGDRLRSLRLQFESAVADAKAEREDAT